MTLLDIIERNQLIYCTPIEEFKDPNGDEVFKHTYYHFFTFDTLLVVNKMQAAYLAPFTIFNMKIRSVYHPAHTKPISPNFKVIMSLHVECKDTGDITRFLQCRSCSLLDEYDIMCFEGITEMLNL